MPRTARKSSKRLPVTPDDLTRFHLVSDPQISPDGRSIAFVKKHIDPDCNEYVTNLWLVPADGSSAPRQFTSGGKDTQPRWSPDGDRVAFVGARDKSKPQVCVMTADGGEAVPVTKFGEGCIGKMRWSPDGTMIAVSFREQHPDWTEQAKEHRKRHGLSDPPRVIDDWWYRLDGDGYFIGQRHHLHLVSVTDGSHRRVYDKDAMGDFSFDFSPDSRRLVIATNRDAKAMIRPSKDELLLLDIRSGRLKPIPDLPEGPKHGVRWSPDGRVIAYAGRTGNDDIYSTGNVELFACDPLHGRARSLTGKEDYCLVAAALSDAADVSFTPHFDFTPDGRRVLMRIGWHGESHLASVGVNGGVMRFHTRGEAMHNFGNISRQGGKVAMTVGTSVALDEVAVAPLEETMRPRRLSTFNEPWLRQRAISRPRSTWVRTADGTRCQVWVIKPPKLKPGRKCPAVLQIHGGPHAQYGVGLFHEFQVLASQGYAVFYSNPRGSKGYGHDHCAAIRGNWGAADWVDIQAVTAFMKRQPFVDAKRMGVMGGSYGGYMTNWVISHTNEFAGAITDRCVSNLVSLCGNSDYVEEPDRYWEGNFWDRPETRWNQSPIKHFGNVRTPTLVIHSEGDLRCNIEQAEQVFTALKLLGVPTRFVRYPSSSSHGMSRNGPPDLRVHRLNQILDWWGKYLR